MKSLHLLTLLCLTLLLRLTPGTASFWPCRFTCCIYWWLQLRAALPTILSTGRTRALILISQYLLCSKHPWHLSFEFRDTGPSLNSALRSTYATVLVERRARGLCSEVTILVFLQERPASFAAILPHGSHTQWLASLMAAFAGTARILLGNIAGYSVLRASMALVYWPVFFWVW
ncbi:hypothetical protein BJ878DRAFT_317944 [Calycina marina]|uniref:Secreted protein n=1 Tax=Calycina marina TaxID=1763456 RepID=A0A9P7Z6Z3_9HELO|nr:hypothetical protein BJ878DRAFT_317944 [Calycina marina]